MKRRTLASLPVITAALLLMGQTGPAPRPSPAPASSAAPATDLSSATEHVVQSGETLNGIAQRAGVPRQQVIDANALIAPYRLRVGQRLVIPRPQVHEVREGETGFSIAYQYGVPWPVIARANGIAVNAQLRPRQMLEIPVPERIAPRPSPGASASPSASPAPAPSASPPATAAIRHAWPVEGRVRRPFAPRATAGRDYHDGIDIVAPAGTAVRASAAGEVIFAGDGPREYGRSVIIHHGGNWTTTYAFLSRVTVQEGDRVRAGERVGLVGQTGTVAREPQLHFELRRNREPQDPLPVLPRRRGE